MGSRGKGEVKGHKETQSSGAWRGQRTRCSDSATVHRPACAAACRSSTLTRCMLQAEAASLGTRLHAIPSHPHDPSAVKLWLSEVSLAMVACHRGQHACG